MAEHPHPTVAVQVWVDVDVGIAEAVVYLNTIPGVRTLASCQGGDTYGPQVMATWTPEAFERLRREFDITQLGEGWGYAHPRGAAGRGDG